MDKADTIIGAIYSRFFLRDVLGKVVPGLILIFTLAYIVGFRWNPQQDIFALRRSFLALPFWGWMGLCAVAWVTAFAVQSFGEMFIGPVATANGRFKTRLWPTDSSTTQELSGWYADYMRFRMLAPQSAVQEHERFVAIMEACGNAGLAILASLVLLGVDTIVHESWAQFRVKVEQFSPAVFAAVVAALLLLRMHYAHRGRQKLALTKALEVIDKSR